MTRYNFICVYMHISLFKIYFKNHEYGLSVFLFYKILLTVNDVFFYITNSRLTQAKAKSLLLKSHILSSPQSSSWPRKMIETSKAAPNSDEPHRSHNKILIVLSKINAFQKKPKISR